MSPVATLVQRELSLDAVRVMRNDLSDADAETRAAMTPEAKSSGMLGMTAKAEVAMDKLSSKLFGPVDA